MTMAPSAIDTMKSGVKTPETIDELPPPHLYTVKEPHFETYRPPNPEGYQRARRMPDGGAAIVIDNGSSAIRAGWSFQNAPQLTLTPLMAKFRDRKLNRTFSFVGNDVYADTTARGHMRNAFEAGTGVVANWDVMENILDAVFVKLGVDGREGRIDVPIVMTEAVANLAYSRKSMNEIVFECYGAPSLSYGIDSLFSYDYNKGRTGIVLSSSHSSTHVIPVVNSKAVLTQATRLNWGGFHAAEYMLKLMKLKYPNFPGKMIASHAEEMVREHCYISKDYDSELSSYLDWTGLEDRDHVIQYPFTEEVVIQKSEEELAKAAEKRKESGRRLQEQAAKMRLEKLVQKEEELEYWRDLQQRLQGQTKKEIRRLLEIDDLNDEAALEKIIKELDKNIRRARTKDVGGPEVEEEVEEPDFSMLEIPDDQLDDAGLKQKRHQRLMKSNHEARARAKAEKEKEKNRLAEEARLDEERRTNDLEGWLADRHVARQTLLQKIKEKDRLKADLGNRKSLASQMRMKSIANLASDNPTKKRRRGGDDDNFGADDDDWGVYRTIAVNEGGSDDEEEEDFAGTLKNLEAELLEHDPSFSPEDTMDAKSDWRKSLMHAFLRGPRPFDPKSQGESNQIHLNVERIRVPEVIFKPGIVGLDQAGLIEILGALLGGNGMVGGADRLDLAKDVFLTGGNAMFKGFEERLAEELRAVMPVGADLVLRGASDKVLDAWRGAARWAGSQRRRGVEISRAEWLEKGGDYIREHDLGNVYA